MSKRSGIILAVLYTDCSAIRKQHSPSVPPLVCFANRRSIGQPQRVTGGAAVLSSDDVGKGRSGVNSKSHREPALGLYAGVDKGGRDWLNYRARVDRHGRGFPSRWQSTIREIASSNAVETQFVPTFPESLSDPLRSARNEVDGGLVTGKTQTGGKPIRHLVSGDSRFQTRRNCRFMLTRPLRLPVLLRETSSGSDAAMGIAFTYGSTCASQASSCQFEDNLTIKSERRFELLELVFLDGIANPATIRLHVDFSLPVRRAQARRTRYIGPPIPPSAASERSRTSE